MTTIRPAAVRAAPPPATYGLPVPIELIDELVRDAERAAVLHGTRFPRAVAILYLRLAVDACLREVGPASFPRLSQLASEWRWTTAEVRALLDDRGAWLTAMETTGARGEAWARVWAERSARSGVARRAGKTAEAAIEATVDAEVEAEREAEADTEVEAERATGSGSHGSRTGAARTTHGSRTDDTGERRESTTEPHGTHTEPTRSPHGSRLARDKKKQRAEGRGQIRVPPSPRGAGGDDRPSDQVEARRREALEAACRLWLPRSEAERQTVLPLVLRGDRAVVDSVRGFLRKRGDVPVGVREREILRALRLVAVEPVPDGVVIAPGPRSEGPPRMQADPAATAVWDRAVEAVRSSGLLDEELLDVWLGEAIAVAVDDEVLHVELRTAYHAEQAPRQAPDEVSALQEACGRRLVLVGALESGRRAAGGGR